MSEFVISSRYANALLSIADENETFDRVLNDITFIYNTLKDSKELRNFLANPIISTSDKLTALNELFKNHINNDLNNFLNLLLEKGRENLLFDICKRFVVLSNEKLNQVEIGITSAVDLSDNQKEELKLKLENIISKKVIPTFSIDSSIIGGFKARYGDTVIDASVKHQLEVLKKKLFEENYLNN